MLGECFSLGSSPRGDLLSVDYVAAIAGNRGGVATRDHGLNHRTGMDTQWRSRTAFHMNRFLKPPRIYLLYFVGLTAASYLGVVVGMLAVFPPIPWRGAGLGSVLTQLNPNECAWLWLPCLGLAICMRGVCSVIGDTVARYTTGTKRQQPGWILGCFCMGTFVSSVLYAGFFLTALS